MSDGTQAALSAVWAAESASAASASEDSARTYSVTAALSATAAQEALVQAQAIAAAGGTGNGSGDGVSSSELTTAVSSAQAAATSATNEAATATTQAQAAASSATAAAGSATTASGSASTASTQATAAASSASAAATSATNAAASAASAQSAASNIATNASGASASANAASISATAAGTSAAAAQTKAQAAAASATAAAQSAAAIATPPTVALGNVSGTVNLDLSQGHGFTLSLTGPATIALVNAPQLAAVQRVAIVLRSNGYAVTWVGIEPFSISSPILSAYGKDLIELLTLDGVEWIGAQVASGFASSVLVEDDFLGAAGVALESRPTNIGNKGWVSNVPGAFTVNGNGVLQATIKGNQNNCLFDSGVSNFTLEITASSQSDDGSDCCLADVLFRTVDFNNTWGVEIDSRFQHVTLHLINNGTADDLCVVSYAGAVSNGQVQLRLDCNDDITTLWLGGVEVATVVNSFNKTATKMGVYTAVGGNTSGTAQWSNGFKVLPYLGNGFNWPNFTKQSSTPLIPLGAAGAWDDTDCNDPNVFFDTPNNRWALCYSGYSNAVNAGASAGITTADSQVQHLGMAYATDIMGPYTKDPANPVMTALPEDGIYAFNGGMVELNGVYYHVYVSNNGSAIRFATSTDLHTWTRHGLIVSTTMPAPVSSWRAQGVFDPFLRIRQDGTTLEMWICGTDGVNKRFGCFTSVDLGVTWVENTAIAPILPPEDVFLNGSAGEPSVFVPPGQEGQQFVLCFDYVQVPGNNSNPPINRRIGMMATDDYGVTQHWRTNASQPGTYGYESTQNFDSFMIWYLNTLYLFNSGSNVSGPALDLNIQIEVQSAPWSFDSLIGS